jgi:TRAP-type C4-dicarboxylate transport system permease small subunit
MGLLLMITVAILSKRRGYPRERRASFGELARATVHAAPAWGSPLIIIGGILAGIFTPTEAAAVASIYALLVGMFVYREIRLAELPRILWETVRTSVQVMFIIASASVFGWLLIQQQVPTKVVEGLMALAGALDRQRHPAPAGLFHGGDRDHAPHDPRVHAARRARGRGSGPLRRRHGLEPDDRPPHTAGGDVPVRRVQHQQGADLAVGPGAGAVHRGPPGLPGFDHLFSMDRRLDSESGHGGGAMSNPTDSSVRGGGSLIDRALDAAMRWVGSVCLVVLLGLVSLIVLIRFWPLVTLGWEDEVVELAFAWMIFLGSAAVWRSHEHIVIDFLPQALAGSTAGRVLEMVVGVLVLGFLGVYTWYGWLLTLQSQGNTSPMLVLPKPLWYAAVPASGVLMIGYTIVRMVNTLRRSAITP